MAGSPLLKMDWEMKFYHYFSTGVCMKIKRQFKRGKFSTIMYRLVFYATRE